MKISHTNFISPLREVVVELSLVLAAFREIEQDIPETHDEIELLNGRCGRALNVLHGIIEYIGKYKPSPGLAGNSLKDSIELTTDILRENPHFERLAETSVS